MHGNTKHGHSGYNRNRTRTYRSWEAMLGRCRNPRNAAYADYGGRGITVCKEWESFENFLRDMGEAPEGLVIDRRDNSAGYCKENCRWVNRKVSGQNTRRVRLSIETAQEIRSLYSTGKYTMKKLGAQFDVTAQTVCYIVNNRQWTT